MPNYFTAFFKLKLHNTAFWLIAPTLISKYYYENEIHERIDNLWRIHCNRIDKGKTYSMHKLITI